MNKFYINKNANRLNISFFDADTDEELFTIRNKTWMEVGEFLTDNYVNSIIKAEISKPDQYPENIAVVIEGEYELKEIS